MMSTEVSEALVLEAKDGISAGASVQILISGYPTWLAVRNLYVHGALLHVILADQSGIFVGKDAIIGVRFGEIGEED